MHRDRHPQTTSSFGGPNNGFDHPFSSNGVSSTSAASSMRCSTPSSWRSDGKMSTSTEKFLPVTLMYSYKNGNRVLFLEAGKDFVDVLLSFLSLPMGAIVRLLYGGGGGGDSTTTGLPLQQQLGPDNEEAIFRLFNSVEKMHEEKFCTSKKSLVDPPEASGFGTRLMRLLHLDAAEQQEPSQSSSVLATSCNHFNPVYYSCGMVPHCVCITKKLGRRCPRHGRKMQAPCRFVEGTRDNHSNNHPASNHHRKPVETGYVKDIGKFFITDGLGIYPGSRSLELLHKLNIESLSLLSSVDIFIGMDEILRLLKASLVSPNVLQEVFGRLVQTRLPPPLAPPSSIVSTTTNTSPPAPPPSILSTTTTETSPPSIPTIKPSSRSKGLKEGLNSLVAFAYDRNRPKYDDYFPRPNCKSLMFW